MGYCVFSQTLDQFEMGARSIDQVVAGVRTAQFPGGTVLRVVLVSLTVWFQPGTRNPKPETRNSKPETRDPEPSNLNHQPSTINSQPSTLNPQPSTLNPQP